MGDISIEKAIGHWWSTAYPKPLDETLSTSAHHKLTTSIQYETENKALGKFCYVTVAELTFGAAIHRVTETTLTTSNWPL